jgi:hypothetical protein
MDEEMKDSDRTQQPVQARDHTDRLWQHAFCLGVYNEQQREDHERYCEPSSWRPLYVLDAAPDGERTPERCTNLPGCPAHPDANPEFTHEVDGTRMHSLTTGRLEPEQPQPDLMAQVMESLGVERPEDVLAAIATERANFADAAQQIARLMYERDEARAEVERYRRDAALEDGLVESLYAEIDRLKAAQPNPLVLRLPEVPEGTVALVGNVTGRRYGWDEGRGEWRYADRSAPNGCYWTNYPAILGREHPGGVTVELAPEPEPQPRTAAEVWAGMREALRAELRDHTVPSELVDALDREARQALINEKGL